MKAAAQTRKGTRDTNPPAKNKDTDQWLAQELAKLNKQATKPPSKTSKQQPADNKSVRSERRDQQGGRVSEKEQKGDRGKERPTKEKSQSSDSKKKERSTHKKKEEDEENYVEYEDDFENYDDDFEPEEAELPKRDAHEHKESKQVDKSDKQGGEKEKGKHEGEDVGVKQIVPDSGFERKQEYDGGRKEADVDFDVNPSTYSVDEEMVEEIETTPSVGRGGFGSGITRQQLQLGTLPTLSSVRAIIDAENAVTTPSSKAHVGSLVVSGSPLGARKVVDVRISKAQQEAIRRMTRARELSKIISFESVVVDLLDMPPLDEYGKFIRYFGRSDSAQQSSQTNDQDDKCDKDMQTNPTFSNNRGVQVPGSGMEDDGGPNTSTGGSTSGENSGGPYDATSLGRLHGDK